MKTMEFDSAAVTEGNSGFAIDTTFVLFFLAVEFGRTFNTFALDTVFLLITLLMLLVLPYFLHTDVRKPGFAEWFFGRTVIAGFAVGVGMMFQMSLGSLLPEMFRFVPMTFLLVAAVASCYIQFNSVWKFRLAK